LIEVVGDIVGDLAHGRHQLLDPRQHEIEAFGQPVELVAGAGYGQPPAEIAGHDGARGRRERVDAGEQLPAHPIAAADAEQRHHPEPPQHGRADHARKLATIFDVAANDQAVSARQPEHIGEGEPPLHASGRRTPVIELDRPDAIPQLGRHRAEISRRAMALAVGDEIEAVAGRLAAFGDDTDELLQPAGPVLLGKTFELGVDRLIELPRQQHRRVPVDIGDGEDRRGAEQRKISQR
jgi:hypothetical protein